MQQTGTGLTFKGIKDLGVKVGFDLDFSLTDKAAKSFLCVGSEDNRVQIPGLRDYPARPPPRSNRRLRRVGPRNTALDDLRKVRWRCERRRSNTRRT